MAHLHLSSSSSSSSSSSRHAVANSLPWNRMQAAVLAEGQEARLEQSDMSFSKVT